YKNIFNKLFKHNQHTFLMKSDYLGNIPGGKRMKKAIVLGATGTIGQIIVHDLVLSDIAVIAADMEEGKLTKLKEKTNNKIETQLLDLKDKEQTVDLLKQGDVCVNATNYIFNIDVMEASAKAGISVLDLGGLFNKTKEQLSLDQKMKDANILSVTGIGSDPGNSNVFSRFGVDYLDEAKEIDIRYGSTSSGVTFAFAIDTYIGEFVQNALTVKDGKLTEIPPLGEKEATQFHEEIGMQETYSIIHSELATFPDSFPNVEKITYKDTWDPETIEKLNTLVSLGLLDEEPINVRGEEIVPRKQTVATMQEVLARTEEPIWDTDSQLVEEKGKKDGKDTKVRLELLTGYQQEWGASPTQYETAIPASITAQMILNGEIKETGVKPPERCINPKVFIEYLKQKNTRLYITY